jgi:hypothetical protein
MNGCIGVLLQIRTRNDVSNTSTIQLSSEFFSTDSFSTATVCLTHNSTRLQTALLLYFLGNTMHLEGSVVSQILILKLSFWILYLGLSWLHVEWK